MGIFKTLKSVEVLDWTKSNQAIRVLCWGNFYDSAIFLVLKLILEASLKGFD